MWKEKGAVTHHVNNKWSDFSPERLLIKSHLFYSKQSSVWNVTDLVYKCGEDQFEDDQGVNQPCLTV